MAFLRNLIRWRMRFVCFHTNSNDITAIKFDCRCVIMTENPLLLISRWWHVHQLLEHEWQNRCRTTDLTKKAFHGRLVYYLKENVTMACWLKTTKDSESTMWSLSQTSCSARTYSWIGTHNHAPGFYANFAMNKLLLNDSLISFCRLWSFDSATGRGLCYVRHSTSSFYPRTVLAFGYCHCLRLCVCVCACINNLFVCAITRDPLKLGSLICSKNAKDRG